MVVALAHGTDGHTVASLLCSHHTVTVDTYPYYAASGRKASRAGRGAVRALDSLSLSLSLSAS